MKSLFNYLYTPNTGHPLVVAPVGAGKSLLIAEFIKRVHADYARTRIVVLTHVKELLEQNAEELEEQYPDCDYGFYCAGLGQKKLYNDVTFASIQSVGKKVADFNRVPELIIIDECHLISHKDTTTYRKFFDEVLLLNPNCKIIGFTGTPFRTDTGRLEEGEGALFDDVVYEISMKYMIDEGYWCRPTTKAVEYKMDVSGVGTRGGDYIASQLQRKVNTAEINDACVKELVEKGAGRNKWLVFTAGVQHCEDVLAEVRAAGISAEMVTGDTPKEERKNIIDRFKRGEFRCLLNVAVLTTGFNVPDIDLLCFMRPTKSHVLYIQTVGRGIRTAYADGYDLTTREGRLSAIANSKKKDCLILDFGGVIDELGPIDEVNVTKKRVIREPREEGEEKAKPITKICPECAEVCYSVQKYCICGYCFIELQDEASKKAIVSDDVEPEKIKVMKGMTTYKRHEGKDGKPDTMVVKYLTMRAGYREWICFDHGDGSWAKNNALSWYNKRAENPEDIPNDLNEALTKKYKEPTHITIKKDGKYWRVIDHHYET